MSHLRCRSCARQRHEHVRHAEVAVELGNFVFEDQVIAERVPGQLVDDAVVLVQIVPAVREDHVRCERLQRSRSSPSSQRLRAGNSCRESARPATVDLARAASSRAAAARVSASRSASALNVTQTKRACGYARTNCSRCRRSRSRCRRSVHRATESSGRASRVRGEGATWSVKVVWRSSPCNARAGTGHQCDSECDAEYRGPSAVTTMMSSTRFEWLRVHPLRSGGPDGLPRCAEFTRRRFAANGTRC